MSIEVEMLTKHYGRQKAIDNISFNARPGEVLGLLGPNGAGKSTTMKILSGFIRQDEGIARVCGMDVMRQSMEVRRNLGYLPENNPLYPEMYVREFLDFIASVYKVEKAAKRIQEVIELTGLGDEQHKKIEMLSKGYRQRVGIARVILHDPRVLILDEPTSGLDPTQLVGIRALISELGKTRTVMVSTHIMQEAEAICHRIVIMNKGKIVANESLSTIREKHPSQSLEDLFVSLTMNVTETK